MKKYALIFLCSCSLNVVFAQTIRYVKPVASGTGNGSSWANASNDLQSVINSSVAGDEVWVAAGTYIPVRRMDALSTISPGDRQNAFVAKGGVNMYGGFSGTEVSKEGRNISSNKTILSGDLNKNDGAFTNMGENAYHVIVFSGATLNNTVFDGFTIADAYYKEGFDPWDMPTVNGQVVHNHFGGSMYVIQASPIISNVRFTRNFLHLGSGLLTYGTDCNAQFINCVFENNKGFYGAAILNYQSNPKFFNTLIYNNEVYYDATISGLEGGEGAAAYNWSSNPVYTNVTIVGNIAAKSGGGFYHAGGTVTLNNSIVYGNEQGNPASPMWQHQIFNNGATVVLNNNIIEDWTGGSNGNLNATGVTADDLFENYTNGNFYLKAGSIALNAGNNTYITGVDTDLDGNDRVIDHIVDLGVFEGKYIEPNPIANDDFVSVTENGSVVIDVTANDENVDRTTVIIVTWPLNGTAVVDPVTGEVTYTPDAAFTGTDTFTYVVCNFASVCDTAEVIITVNSGSTVSIGLIDSGKESLSLYPNPSGGNSTLAIYSDELHKNCVVELYDALGKCVRSISVSLNSGKNEIVLSGSELQKGMYLIHVKVGNSAYHQRWILNQ